MELLFFQISNAIKQKGTHFFGIFIEKQYLCTHFIFTHAHNKIMNILLIETSAKACSVALCHDFNIEFKRETLEGPNHASVLGQFVEDTIQYARQNDMMPDAVAVSAGPGSYTGLRIGVSEAKGVAFGLNIPLIGIPTLEALCCHVMFCPILEEGMPEGGYYCPMIDARRMEVYTALYDNALNEVRPIKAEVIDEHFLEKELEEHPIYFFGDGADKCQEVIKHPNAHFIPNVRVMASDMMALAIKRFNQGKFDDTAYFVPFYLKEFVATLPKNQLQ